MTFTGGKVIAIGKLKSPSAAIKVKIRQTPKRVGDSINSPNSNILAEVVSGTQVKVLEKGTGDAVSGSTTWYKVVYEAPQPDIVGWVHSSVIDLSSVVNPTDPGNNPPEKDTLLRFKTNTGMEVRIFTKGGQSYMNVFNKPKNVTELSGALAVRERDTTTRRITYRANNKQYTYTVVFIPSGDVSLTIRELDGDLVASERGVGPTGNEWAA
ncbi:SH3 domain-containing protein [Calothrix sp. 336/3]|uniref:SH3 domain-containing protein n=1 Tax=Calothrix sp. 336/3 TaxID=1337936 RepID=UPI0004E43248|nr:SH3 domain-containing protein [Calothrix sp. 336/3]AKG22669.1 hypothetical protein IJ00_16560 [Calothrix sp. 336/3]